MKTDPVTLCSLACLLALPVATWGIDTAPPANPVPAQVPDLVTIQEIQPASTLPKPPALKAAGDLIPEITKMLNAATPQDVIRTFIENWTTPFAVSADDVLRLHDIGASSDVLTSLIRRSAQLQASATVAASPGTTNAAPPGPVETNAPAVLYPYPSSPYPPNVYSYLYPDYLLPDYSYAYSCWAAPYPYWYGYSPYYSYYWWPSYRFNSSRFGHYGYGYGYGYGYRHPYGYGYGSGFHYGRPGFSGGFGRPGPGFGGRPGFGGHPGGFGGFGGRGGGFSGHMGGHGRR